MRANTDLRSLVLANAPASNLGNVGSALLAAVAGRCIVCKSRVVAGYVCDACRNS